MTPRILEAIDIFLDAINKGTLAKGTCAACACGNLINASLNRPYEFNELVKNDALHIAVSKLNAEYFFGSDEKQSNTKFSFDELKKIEIAFEDGSRIHWISYPEYSKEDIRKDQIEGLEAVVKVMLEFDEQEDIVEEIFSKKAELISMN